MKQLAMETLFQYRFLSAPAFSPDGEWLAYLVRQADPKENCYLCDLYVYNVAGGNSRRLTQDGKVRSFFWTPENTLLLAYPHPEDSFGTELREVSPQGNALGGGFSLPVKVMELIPLEPDLFVVLGEWRHPEKANAPDAPYDVFEELPFRWNAQGLVNGVRKRLYLYRRSSRCFTPVTGEDFYVGNLSTSPWRLSAMGDFILFIGQGMADGVQKQYPGLYSYHIPTGQTRCYIPDGRQKVEVAQILENGRAIVTTTPGREFGSSQMPEFYLLDLAGGEMELLCHYELSVGAAITTDAALGSGITNKAYRDAMYFVTMEGGSSYLRRITAGGELSSFLTPEGSCASFDVQGEHIACLGMYGNGLRELYLDGKQITFFNQPILSEYTLSTPIPLSSRRPGGELVQGWVMPPVGYEKGKSYPGILNIHGGPHAAFGPTFFHEMQVWANAGYFVFYCNPHGSDGRGNAFGDMRGIYGTIDYQDLMAFTDQVLEAYPDIDPGRLGVTGGSYGGYMTNWIIGHTNRFRCAASQRSISDWAISEMVSDCGYQRNAAKMGASALEDHEKVWWHSPLRYAPAVTTPTLFLHSYEDYRCHHVQAIAMYTALRQRGIESRLCIFKGENHELSRSGKPQNRISRMKEILCWMDRYLK